MEMKEKQVFQIGQEVTFDQGLSVACQRKEWRRLHIKGAHSSLRKSAEIKSLALHVSLTLTLIQS